jgi:hypothetical protein
MMPMLALPPAVPLVVNTLPVLNVGSTKVRFRPVAICAEAPAASVGVLIVAVEPSAETATIVVFGSIVPAGPATYTGSVAVPTSDARNVPGAAVNVVEPAVHDTPRICRPGFARAVNVWVYV